MYSAFSRNRGIATLLVAAAAITACDNYDSPIVPKAESAELVLGLKVSSMIADPGEKISLALDPEFAGRLGGVSGTVRFNASKLEYVGQSVEDGILMVNTRDAARGELRIASAHETGFVGDIGSLIFRVTGGDYLPTISFDADDAVAYFADGARKIEDITVNRWTSEDRAQPVGEAVMMSSDDWMRRLMPGRDPKFGTTFARPGDLAVPNLKYGDVNLSGGATPVDLDDVIFLLNVTVGNFELIVDADTTTFGGAGAGRRDAVIAGNVDPINSPGLGEPGDALRPGINAPGDFGQIDLGDVIVVLNEIVNPAAQPVAGEIIPGRAAATPGRVIVSANITTNTTWTSNNVYELSGPILVNSGATLTIQPGTQVEGARGTTPGTAGSLFVQRDGRIVADGTPLQPIVFTCVGLPKSKGCWGGLTISGNARLNEGTATSPAVAGRDSSATGCFEKTGEGGSGLYGGCNDADSSGVLRYVRVEYPGFRFSATNELNALALQGVGNRTVIDYVQVHAGLDDGIEMFGGSVNLRHIVSTANQDDSFDWVESWSGAAQFILIQADSLDGDKGFEGDNTNTSFDALPRAMPTICNVTMVGKADPTSASGANPANNVEAGMHIRRGTRPYICNAAIQNYPIALIVDDASTCTTTASSTPGFTTSQFIIAGASVSQNTTLVTNNAGASTCGPTFWTARATGATFPATSILANPLLVQTPDFRPRFGLGTGGVVPPTQTQTDAGPVGPTSRPAYATGFDVSANYIGATPPANSAKSNIPWYAGWTRPWQSNVAP